MAACTACQATTGLLLFNTGRMAGPPEDAQSPARVIALLSSVEVCELHCTTCRHTVAGIVEHGHLVPFLDSEPIQNLGGDG